MNPIFSEQVRYVPWHGQLYDKQPERWLILAESSYGEAGPNEREWLPEMIGRHLADNDDHFTICSRLEHLLTGEAQRTTAGRMGFWQRVAYYNYVTTLLDKGARPTPDQFARSHDAFSEVICQLKPHVVMVCGLELWDRLPGEKQGWTRRLVQPQVPMPSSETETLSLWQGTAEWNGSAHRFQCFPIAHPSWRHFGAVTRWLPWVQAAQKAALDSSGEASQA